MADNLACDSCGQPHVTANGEPSCNGHVRFNRDTYVKGQPRERLDKPRPCRKRPLTGQVICGAHGGDAPQNLAAGAVREMARAVEAEAQALLAFEGLEGIEDPIAEIGKLAQEARALKLALGKRVNALEQMRYTGGLERDENGELRGTGTEQTRAEFLAFERAMDRQMKFLEVVVKHAGGGNVDQTKAMMTRIGEAFGISE